MDIKQKLKDMSSYILAENPTLDLKKMPSIGQVIEEDVRRTFSRSIHDGYIRENEIQRMIMDRFRNISLDRVNLKNVINEVIIDSDEAITLKFAELRSLVKNTGHLQFLRKYGIAKKHLEVELSIIEQNLSRYDGFNDVKGGIAICYIRDWVNRTAYCIYSGSRANNIRVNIIWEREKIKYLFKLFIMDKLKNVDAIYIIKVFIVNFIKQ